MVTVGKKLCLYNTHTEHELVLEQCELRLVIPGEVIIPIQFVYEIAAQGLWGADNTTDHRLHCLRYVVPY